MPNTTLLWLSILLLCTQPLEAQEVKEVIPWNDHWVQLDPESGTLIPLAASSQQRMQSGSLLLSRTEFGHLGLQICTEGGTSLFLNHQIVRYQETNACFTLACDSMFDTMETDTLLLTLYHPDFQLSKNSFALLSGYKLPDLVETVTLTQRLTNPATAFYLSTSLILLFILAAFRRINPRGLQEFYNFRLALTLNTNMESRFNIRLFDQFNIALIALHCGCMAFLCILIALQVERWASLFPFLLVASGTQLLFYWVGGTVLALLALLIKYLLTRMVAGWFQLGTFADLHILNYIRLSAGVYAITTVLLVAASTSEMLSFAGTSLALVVLTVGLTIRTSVLFFKLLAFSNLRKLHLFSYLCTTEIIPLLISIKILYYGL